MCIISLLAPQVRNKSNLSKMYDTWIGGQLNSTLSGVVVSQSQQYSGVLVDPAIPDHSFNSNIQWHFWYACLSCFRFFAYGSEWGRGRYREGQTVFYIPFLLALNIITTVQHFEKTLQLFAWRWWEDQYHSRICQVNMKQQMVSLI